MTSSNLILNRVFSKNILSALLDGDKSEQCILCCY